MKSFLFLLPVLLLAGCAGIHQAPVGANALLPGKTADQARASSIEYLTANGWLPLRSDSLMIQFEHDASFNESLFMTQAGSQAPRYRLNLTFLPQDDGSKILGHVSLAYARQGTQQETTTNITNEKARQIVESIRCHTLGLPAPVFAAATTNAPARTGKGF